MIFTIILWMLLTEIDFEISFARQIAAFDNLNLFFKGILAKITSITDSRYRNSIFGKNSSTLPYQPSVTKSDSTASTSSSLPSYRSEDSPSYCNQNGMLSPLYEETV
jgi:hypothetical protein